MHDTTLAVKKAHTHDDSQFSSSQFIDTVLHFLYMFVFYLFGLSNVCVLFHIK